MVPVGSAARNKTGPKINQVAVVAGSPGPDERIPEKIFIMNLLFPVAFAQDAAQASPTPLYVNLLLFGGMIVLFYLILWRPQAKKNKEHKELVSSISKGDEVMTAGGILGKVTKIGDEYIAVEIAQNTEIKLQRSSILAALPKGTIAQI